MGAWRIYLTQARKIPQKGRWRHSDRIRDKETKVAHYRTSVEVPVCCLHEPFAATAVSDVEVMQRGQCACGGDLEYRAVTIGAAQSSRSVTCRLAPTFPVQTPSCLPSFSGA